MLNWIDDYILGLIDYYKTRNIYELYDCLGISIVKLDKDSILLNGNEALYNRTLFDGEVVFIRNDLSREYEKFVLAHELAHAIIHTHIKTSAFNINLINTDKMDRQANYFALKLLNYNLDSVSYEGFTLEQIAVSLGLPVKCLEILK